MTRRDLIKNSLLMGALYWGWNSKSFANLLISNNTIFDTIINKSEKFNWSKLPINQLIINIAKEFVGTPYIGGTLDNSTVERCTVNLEGLDCVTFFENSLAIARIIKKNKLTYNDFIRELTYTRYRDGILDGYTSRLHYTSEWIVNNIKKGVVIDKSELIGGLEFHPNVFFMSKYPEKYKQLNGNQSLIEKIKSYEEFINKSTLYYIPNSEIEISESMIDSGDIIAIATNIPGLDYSHTGLAYRDENNSLRFFHASSAKKQVLIDIQLGQYLQSKKKDIGITVFKAIEPKV